MNATTVAHGSASTTLAELVGLENPMRMDKTGVGITDEDLGVSPVTLSPSWSRVARLLLLTSLAVGGSVGNVFMISAIVVEEQLKKRGNAFLVNVALADLLVTGFVIPASVIVILAGQEESLTICRVEWTVQSICFLVTVLTLTTIAAENYARLCLSPERYNVLTTSRVTGTLIAIWIIAVIAVSLQSYIDDGPDFCRRKFDGITMKQVIGVTILIGLPAVTTTLLYAILILCVRRATRGSYKPPITFSWDYELTKANIYSCLMFIIFWLPFGTAVCMNSFRPISSHVLYGLAWLAFSKPCFNNLLYCVANRHFRSAYVKLFHYCCCKTTVNFSRRTRADAGRNSSDVRLRVHIIHSYASPASCRPTVNRPNGREVYEL